MTVWLLQCDKRATVCFCAWWCAFFASVVVCFMHRNAICLCALLCFPVIFYFFRVFLRRQCAACTHERKRNIVRSVSLYSGTYQLKGCCLDGLRWGYSVKKKNKPFKCQSTGGSFSPHIWLLKISQLRVEEAAQAEDCGCFFFNFFFILLQFTHISCSAIFLIFPVFSHTRIWLKTYCTTQNKREKHHLNMLFNIWVGFGYNHS